MQSTCTCCICMVHIYLSSLHLVHTYQWPIHYVHRCDTLRWYIDIGNTGLWIIHIHCRYIWCIYMDVLRLSISLRTCGDTCAIFAHGAHINRARIHLQMNMKMCLQMCYI
jgi:hypothetical protein